MVIFMTMARVILDDYSNKVVNVVKAKYSLKDKSEALNKFLHMYGREENVEEEVSDKYLAKILKIEERHFKKYGYRNTSIADLKKEIEG